MRRGSARAAGRRSRRSRRRARRARRRRRPRRGGRAARSGAPPRRRPRARAGRPHARRRRSARGSYGGRSDVTPACRGRELAAANTDTAAAHGSTSAPSADERVVELAGGPVPAAVQLSAQHEPGAHAGADREEQEVVDAARDAAPLLAERRQVDVVLEPNRQRRGVGAARSANVASLEPGHVRRRARRDASSGVDDTRHADDRAVDPSSARPPVAVDELFAERRRRRRASTRGRSPTNGTSWRARTCPRGRRARARRNRAPMSSAEHERRLGHRLEEDGAVVRAAGVGRRSRERGRCSSSARSASETVGFEMPVRRAISAREIGAPPRIASSTARSFSCFRSGGVARRSTGPCRSK